MVKNRHSKRIRQDYHRKSLENPFFARKKTGKSGGFLKWLIGLGILTVALIWFFLASSFWRWQVIEVEGLTRIPTGEIEAVVWRQADQSRLLIFKQSNLLLFDAEEAAQQIITDYNLANSVIKKDWPRTIRIIVSERPYAFIFQEGSDFFHAAADGYIIKEPAVMPEELDKYPILENKNDTKLFDDASRLNIKNDYLQFFLDLSASLESQAELKADRYIIDQEFNMITVKFRDGPAVYFNVKNDPVEQLERLLLVKREKIKDNFSRMNYIDLRYGDRIFINPDLN